MDRVGGYASLLALECDARRYDDVIAIVMPAEGQAARQREREERLQHARK